ncbi:hypothetical protein BDM02DRAFT_3119883 [Thelephora ganbajun]|uniref:Uncharacterized protein n=1 Tax=Thelephora ganbajun TaxID=370292 RepID=A0ACB6Z7Z6_THEGA|nr:hypothetical protein BDM02DRAFT_3119883 [Thelephora ganbajun]
MQDRVDSKLMVREESYGRPRRIALDSANTTARRPRDMKRNSRRTTTKISISSRYSNPQLQPDSNEETAALFRVLIHKINNTTLCGDVPPPHSCRLDKREALQRMQASSPGQSWTRCTRESDMMHWSSTRP